MAKNNKTLPTTTTTTTVADEGSLMLEGDFSDSGGILSLKPDTKLIPDDTTFKETNLVVHSFFRGPLPHFWPENIR